MVGYIIERDAIVNFKDFVELTRPVIGGKEGLHTYVHSLFDAILNEDYHEILKGYSDNSFKAYGNGNTQITGIAKAITAHLDTVEFASFIYELDESAQIELEQRFKPYLPKIDARNVGDEIADLFADIIRDAASTKRKRTASKEDNAELIESEVVDDDEP